MEVQQVTSLKGALSAAHTEAGTTFELLGDARERSAELADALKAANEQLRALQAEVDALRNNEGDDGVSEGDLLGERQAQEKQAELMQENEKLSEQLRALQGEVDALRNIEGDDVVSGSDLLGERQGELVQENEKLREQLRALQAEVDALREQESGDNNDAKVRDFWHLQIPG